MKKNLFNKFSKKHFQILFVAAIIFAGQLHAQKLSPVLKSIPSHAIVYDMEKNELGATPFDLSKLRMSITGIKVVEEGYDPAIITFSEKDKFRTFPSSVKSCINCNLQVEDPINNTGPLVLRKKIKEKEKSIMVAIDTPRITISQETELGRVNSDRKIMKDRDIHLLLGYPENMELNLVNSFRDSYLEAHFISYKNKEDINLYKPKIILKPLVKKLNFNLKGKLLRDYTGPCTMECLWLVSDLSDRSKILAQLNITTNIYRFGDNYDLILHQMLSESVRDLLDNDTLFAYLSRLEKSYLARSKKEALKIKLVKQATFTDTKEMLKAIASSVVTIENDEGFGSGSIISADGYILTSYHVISGEKTVMIRHGNSEKIKASVERVNKDYDLALLKISGEEFTALRFGNSDKADVGDEVYAAGTPLEKALKQTVTRGIISGFREWNGVNFIQTDVTINSGNSGGPMLNSKGEIIGITTMKLVGKGIEGIGFGIPSNVAVEMLNLKFED